MDVSHDQSRDDPITQITVSLAEIDALRGQVVDLKTHNTELQSQLKSLQKQLDDLTNPAKAADAAAYRRSRGFS
jgi:peptidoglycan hydrolase CwlO-like protein